MIKIQRKDIPHSLIFFIVGLIYNFIPHIKKKFSLNNRPVIYLFTLKKVLFLLKIKKK